MKNQKTLWIQILVGVFALVLVVGLISSLSGGLDFDTDLPGGSGVPTDTETDKVTTETVERSEGDAACEHTYDEGVVEKAATCKEEGVIVYTCTKCHKTKDDVISITNVHTYADSEKYDTNQHVYSCTVCYKAEAAVYEDHKYSVSSTPDTCTTVGSTVYSCACGYVYSVPVNVITDHNITSWHKIENDSINHNGWCTLCAATVKRGHDYGAEQTVSATCTEAGSKSKSCLTCGYLDTSVIPPLGHDLVEDTSWEGKVAATCVAEGKKRMICNRDGCSYYETVTIPKTLHSYSGQYVSNGDNTHSLVCDVCGYVKSTISCAPIGNYEYSDSTYHVGTCGTCGGNIKHTHTKIYDADQNPYCPACNHSLE